MDECVDQFQKMLVKDRSLAWEQWLAATEILKELLCLPIHNQTRTTEDQLPLCVNDCKENQNSEKIDVMEEAAINQIAADSQKGYPPETKTQLECCENTPTTCMITDASKSTLTPSRRSSRKRQLNPKFQDMYELQQQQPRICKTEKDLNQNRNCTNKVRQDPQREDDNYQVESVQEDKTIHEDLDRIENQTEKQSTMDIAMLCHAIMSDTKDQAKPILVSRERVSLTQDDQDRVGSDDGRSTKKTCDNVYSEHRDNRATSKSYTLCSTLFLF